MESGPSDIALNWMIRQAQPNLLVDQARLQTLLPAGSGSIDKPEIHDSLEGWWKTAAYLPHPTEKWKRRWKIYAGERRFIANGS